MFSRVLIANRGEIACRVARTCARLGIESVAVYSDADRGARHVEEAAASVHIGGAAAAQSYLRVEAIIDAALKSGAQAIHPGYGFLSERTTLIEACVAAGLTFVGPHLEAVRSMGSKIDSKRIARGIGVPCIAGYDGDTQDDRRLEDEARRIGFPLLIKASAGGGGKGMRLVRSIETFLDQLALARREAAAGFGDDRVLLERYIERPRHVEVQLLGDRHGGLVHLFERECSIQRNYQKLVEEAPAHHLSDAVRARLFDAALSLGRAIRYDSTGTVEFVLDADDGDAPYFLEMNTRLQVEHPVTEATTGFDLVEWQLRCAAGECLPYQQDSIRQSGWAIEARVNAEVPEDGFAPSLGAVRRYCEPRDAPGMRVDSAVRTGSEITPHYDSMVAKVIGFGASRAVAVHRLRRGLSELRIEGIQTNQPLLLDILGLDRFEAVLSTRFLTEAFPDGWKPSAAGRQELRFAAAAAWFFDQLPPEQTVLGSLVGLRLTSPAGIAARYPVLVTEDECQEVIDVCAAERNRIICESGQVRHEFVRATDSTWRSGSGRSLRAHIDAQMVDVWSNGDFRRVEVIASVAQVPKTEQGGGLGLLRAQLPGIVSQVMVTVGDDVTRGQPVLVIEAMKLLHTLSAPTDGRIIRLAICQGETVAKGDLLLEIAGPQSDAVK